MSDSLLWCANIILIFLTSTWPKFCLPLTVCSAGNFFIFILEYYGEVGLDSLWIIQINKHIDSHTDKDIDIYIYTDTVTRFEILYWAIK